MTVFERLALYDRTKQDIQRLVALLPVLSELVDERISECREKLQIRDGVQGQSELLSDE
jgi:hypothetical protein